MYLSPSRVKSISKDAYQTRELVCWTYEGCRGCEVVDQVMPLLLLNSPESREVIDRCLPHGELVIPCSGGVPLPMCQSTYYVPM